MNLRKLLRSNTYLTGILIGIISPIPTIAILALLFRLIMHLTGNHTFIDDRGILLLGIVPDILLIRYFLIKANDEKTARSLVFVTAVLVILFFMFIHNQPFNLPF
ncbi:MAG: hypothetical protein HXX13_12275 [Bacteroidetes bacterium]|nr:hypothetical protein [Bacteroidota bacterium]